MALYLRMKIACDDFLLPAVEIETIFGLDQIRSDHSQRTALFGHVVYRKRVIPVIDARFALFSHASDLFLTSRVLVLPDPIKSDSFAGILVEKAIDLISADCQALFNNSPREVLSDHRVLIENSSYQPLLVAAVITHDRGRTYDK